MRRPRSPATRATLWYLALAASWIVLSDLALRDVHETSDGRAEQLDMLKGLGFVLVTAALLHVLVRRAVASVREQSERAEHTEQRWRDLFADTPLPLVVVHPVSLDIVEANRAMADLTGLDGGQLRGQPLTRYLRDGEIVDLAAALDEAEGTDSDLGRWRVARDDRDRWVDLTAAATTFAGIPAYLVWADDVSTAVESERARTETERWVRDVLAATEVVVWTLDPTTYDLRFVSGSTAALFGREPGELIAHPELRTQIVHPDDVATVAALDAEAVAAGSAEADFRIVRPDGVVRWMRAHERTTVIGRRVARVEGFVRDITAEREATAAAAAMASRDALTGLRNRHTFTQHVAAALSGSDAPEVALAVLDLDQFATINHAHGADTGDLALVAVAERLADALGPFDQLARVGDDEFAVLLAGADEGDLTDRVDRLFEVFERTFVVDGHDMAITATGGVATPVRGVTADGLLLDALAAAKRCKETEPGTYLFGRPDQPDEARTSVQLVTDLRRAITGGELEVHYQPEVDPVTGEVGAFEALVRWNRPGEGLVGPGVFMAAAERTGLVRGIGHVVLETVACDLARWSTPPHRSAPVIWMNLSRAELGDERLGDVIDDVVEQHAVARRRLGFEVTETAFLTDAGSAVRTLTRLHDAGHPIALDDFGTGWSSLVSLRDLPIDVVKVDREFVSRVTTDRSSLAIVRAVVALAHGLGMTIVAEGAEERAEIDLLTSIGCDRIQGWHYAAAMPRDDADRFVTEGFDPHR